MERKVLGEVIHSIDYIKAKDRHSYKDQEYNPFTHLEDILRKCDDVTFPEFKSTHFKMYPLSLHTLGAGNWQYLYLAQLLAAAENIYRIRPIQNLVNFRKHAFEEFEVKICINSFPGALSPAFNLAKLTADILIRMARDLVDADQTMATQVTETILQALRALFQASLRSTHCHLADILMKCRTPSIEQHLQSLGHESLVQLITAAQVNLQYVPSDHCSELDQASCQRYTIGRFYNMLSAEQLKLVQREVIDAYLYYLSQAPSMSKTFMKVLNYFIQDIVLKYKYENPFLGLKDKDVICKALCVIQDVACCKNYTKETPIDASVTRTLRHIIKTILDDGILDDVFEQLALVIVQISKTDIEGKQKENIYMIIRTKLFSYLKDHKVQDLCKPCITMIQGVSSQENVSTEAESMMKSAFDNIVLKVNPGDPEKITLYLQSVSAIVNSGKEKLLKLGTELLKRLKKMRGFDWKNHVKEADDVLNAIRDIPGSKVKGRYWDYRDFLEEMETQFKKDKMLPKMQTTIISCFFGCLLDKSCRKHEVAANISARSLIVFSRGDKTTRIYVLERCQQILHNTELSWDDSDMATAFTGILRRVIDSYGRSGRMVTERECELIMSIFMHAVQGGDAIQDHFYEKDKENTPNINYKLLDEFKCFIIQDLNTNVFNAMVIEVMRWLKKATTDNHEDLQKLTFRILKGISQFYLTSLKDVLQDIVDVMIQLEIYDELSGIVKDLYPLNPAALDDKLPFMLDQIADNQELMQKSVLSLIDKTIASIHPEIFTACQISKLIDFCSTTDQHGQVLVLSIICHIAERIPDQLLDFLPEMCDESLFNPDTIGDFEYIRIKVIYLTGLTHQIAGQKAIEYMISYVARTSSSTTICIYVMSVLEALIKQYQDLTGKYTDQFKALQETVSQKTGKEAPPHLLIVGGMTFIDGKQVVRDMEQQEENIAELDTKVDVAMDNVVTIGDKVMEHDKEIDELGDGLERLDEKLDDVNLS